MASYAEAALRSPDPPPRDAVRHLIAHFSGKLESGTLLSELRKISKRSPCGFEPHPRGALIVLRSEEDLSQVLASTKGSLKVGSKMINLSALEIRTPVPQRGKRWRISRVPFWASHAQITTALAEAGLEITALKLETVEGHPDVRTPYATIWIKDPSKVPPKTLKIDGAKMLVFDPTNPSKPAKPKAANNFTPAKSASSMEPDLKGLPTPQTPASATPKEYPVSPTPATATSHERPLAAAPVTPGKNLSPLQNRSPPPVTSFLEESGPFIDLGLFTSLGFPIPPYNATLSIYEDITDPEQASQAAHKVPSPIGKTSKNYTKPLHKEGSASEDWFVLSSQTEEDPDMAVLLDLYGSISSEVVDRYFDRMGWLQQLSTKNGMILVIYKSRIAHHKSRFYGNQRPKHPPAL